MPLSVAVRVSPNADTVTTAQHSLAVVPIRDDIRVSVMVTDLGIHLHELDSGTQAVLLWDRLAELIVSGRLTIRYGVVVDGRLRHTLESWEDAQNKAADARLGGRSASVIEIE
jgi:hypothetical protein